MLRKFAAPARTLRVELPKLFVAAEIPRTASAALTLIQPPPVRSIRLTAPDQMHLTLHYIGESDVERIALALESLVANALSLEIRGVGQFLSADGAVTLWARVLPSEELKALHESLATALASEGFQPETRPYKPHITLARCEPDVPQAVVDEFLNQHAAFSLPQIPIVNFGLFSSNHVNNVPIYRCERSFQLLTK